ncbi:hypothetical protein ACQEVP_39235, partial [Streptomyces sp. CA-132043]
MDDNLVAELQRLARLIRSCDRWWFPVLQEWEALGQGFGTRRSSSGPCWPCSTRSDPWATAVSQSPLRTWIPAHPRSRCERHGREAHPVARCARPADQHPALRIQRHSRTPLSYDAAWRQARMLRCPDEMIYRVHGHHADSAPTPTTLPAVAAHQILS